MKPIKPEDRQTAIDALTKVLLEKTTGHTEAEARDVATAMVDEAIRYREDDGHAAD